MNSYMYFSNRHILLLLNKIKIIDFLNYCYIKLVEEHGLESSTKPQKTKPR